MKRLILILLILGAAMPTAALAQESATGTPPVTKEQLLVSARTVALIGALGHVAQTGIALNPSAEKAQKLLEKEVRKWGRFTVIENPAQADLVLVLWEGNRAAGGGGVIRTARLGVMPGGQPPNNGDLPLWDDDANGSIFATSGAPKVIAAFRAYLENLDKKITKIELPTSHAPATPANNQETAGSGANAPSHSEKRVARPRKYVPPLEIIGRAKTFTLRGEGAAGEQGTFDTLFGVGQYSNIQSAMRQIHQEMTASGKVEFVQEVPKADLVIVVYQWDTRVYSKQFHGVRTAIQIAEGGESFQREDPALWASGTVKGPVQEVMDSLRLDLYQAARLENLQAAHTANKSYQHACDWMESAEKKSGAHRSDLLFEAVAELRKSLSEEYAYAPAHERLGTALRQLGFNANAAYEYRIAVRLQPGMQDALHGLVTSLSAIPDYEEAVIAAQDLVRVIPQSSDAYLTLGDVEFARKNYSEAAKNYQQGIAQDPGRAVAHEKLGRSLYRAKRMTEAESSLREALRLSPNQPGPMLWLGSTLNELGRPQEAAEVLRSLIKIRDGGSAHFELGRALRTTKQFDQAIPELHKALEFDPTAFTFHVELAHTLEDAGKNEEALAKYQEIIRNAPNQADVHVDLAGMLLKTGHPDQAIAESEEAVRLDGACARAYMQLGRSREAHGDVVRAQAAYEKGHAMEQGGTSNSCNSVASP